MRIFIAGATGVLSRRTIPHLRAAGHQVIRLARDVDRVALVRLPAAEVQIGTLFVCPTFKEGMAEAWRESAKLACKVLPSSFL